ncbi:VQ motif-containing protein 25-like [Cucumis melo var. makuwa]|uniref:VQ motif-containing protein 25-like n=2 Tax=Cucumis melo TaxID=3656 RepID=A0A5A7TRB0_CUCMM|nr:VQ motif-containing protein 25-like [Cucumis melo var. makuwa]TYK25403.1 VQ motif-containing protein 25-like [Cucumis melo var. makuwa]
MDAILKNQRQRPHLLPTSPRPSTMPLHSASHAISKPKPKIRIIHIFAPEIIKTDVANFRELVQRLTGKPEAITTQEDKILPPQIPAAAAFDNRKTEMVSCRRMVKKEDEDQEEDYDEEEEEEEGEGEGEEEEEMLDEVVGMWNDVVGFEGFIQELGEFPLIPSAHQIMHGFEDTHFV